ncbi:MAG TPA: ATP-dependent Clp protease proteolytic subunit [Pirellulales bacterium]|nr:ATP-dependent Clp protease proteolytic subunit [Pirellulales bacterium]
MVGDLCEHEAEITAKLLELPANAPCVLYFDSPGGSAYSGMAIMSLIRLRGLRATGIVIGECSSAAVWPFAACQRRLVLPHSVLLFHPMKWQSEEHVLLAEAAEWARHFGLLETQMDELLAELLGVSPATLSAWTRPGRHLSGGELVEAGVAELAELKTLPVFDRNGRAPRKRVAIR